MNKIYNFINDQKESMAIFCTPLVIMSLTYKMFGVETYLVIQVWLLSLFIFGMYLFIKYSSYQKQLSNQEKITILHSEKQEMIDQLNRYRSETETYFLTWLHQMKTPITASQLLLRDVEDKRGDDLKIQLTDIEKYTDMALSYVKLLNPGTDLDFVRISIDDLIAPLIKKYRYLFIYHQIKLNYTPSQAVVITDANWSKVMIEQLLSNALKYTPKGGTISISYQMDARILSISDTGIGIQPEDLAKIFDKGYVGLNGRRHQKASGVGLYLVSLISKRLDQPVAVDSRVNVGSTFAVQFNLTEL